MQFLDFLLSFFISTGTASNEEEEEDDDGKEDDGDDGEEDDGDDEGDDGEAAAFESTLLGSGLVGSCFSDSLPLPLLLLT